LSGQTGYNAGNFLGSRVKNRRGKNCAQGGEKVPRKDYQSSKVDTGDQKPYSLKPWLPWIEKGR